VQDGEGMEELDEGAAERFRDQEILARKGNKFSHFLFLPLPSHSPLIPPIPPPYTLHPKSKVHSPQSKQARHSARALNEAQPLTAGK
jgi:hypothetical protein